MADAGKLLYQILFDASVAVRVLRVQAHRGAERAKQRIAEAVAV